MADPRPIYARIAAELRDHIGSGALREGDRAPSTNELSAFHSVNPTTSGKALAELVADGLLEKRRGLGMFVVPGGGPAPCRARTGSRRRHAGRADRRRKEEEMTIGISDVVVRRRGHTILDRASVELGPGIHGVIGRNGVGKTTLLRVLAHHMRVTAGTVHGPGTTALARVAPDVRFAGATAGQHLDVAAVGHPGLDRELALDVLAAAGIGARTRTATLSAGRRQLLSVATALSSGCLLYTSPSPRDRG